MSDAPTRESRPAKAVVPPLLAAGQQLGGYQVVRLVGKGGMGEVYQARQLSMDREVALKVLSPRLAQKDPSFAKRFVEEARAAGKLNHANIIHVHDVSTATLPDGTEGHFFSMEFIDGESVQAILDREGRLSAAQLRTVMTGVAEALGFAAKAGIVHRDIKPDNIMITKSGLVKVADLGLAVPSQTGDDHAPERDEKGRAKVMGTPLYLSPEQARALPVDHRSDQYSLGATLFHFLTGDAPYRGPDAKSIMKAHVVDPVPDPAERVEDVDEAWRQLCMRLMAKKPEERFATAKELVEAVEAACEGVTIEQLERRKRGFHIPPHVRMWALIALGAVVLLLAFILLLRQGGGRAAEPVPEPAPPQSQTPVHPVAPVAPAKPDLSAFDKALGEQRFVDARAALAAIPAGPESTAAAARLAFRLAEARKELGVQVAAAKAPADLDGILAKAAAQLPDEDKTWLRGAIDARKAELAPPKPAAPTDADRWKDLARQIDKARGTMAFDEVRSAAERAAGTFADAGAKGAMPGLAQAGVMAQNGEMALRAYIGAAQPHTTIEIGGKPVDVLLNRLSKTEVFYIIQQKGGAPGPEQRVERSKIAMPWDALLDEAIKDQGVEHPLRTKAATLWMWGLPEAKAALERVKDSDVGKAVEALDRNRK